MRSFMARQQATDTLEVESAPLTISGEGHLAHGEIVRRRGRTVLHACAAAFAGVAMLSAIHYGVSPGAVGQHSDDIGAAASLVESGCSGKWQDCRSSRCCQEKGMSCFEKNDKWAMCMPECVPGVHEGDPDDTPWSCRALWSKKQVQMEWQYAEKRAWKVMSTLPRDAKQILTHGSSGGNGYAGYVNPQWSVEGSQALTMNDGPQGFNTYQESLKGTSTQFPALLSVAASFDTETSRQYATAVAEEFVGKGSNVMLGPDVEVTRATLTGRSFETISGEDPFLGSRLVQPFVRAVQSQGIMATVKHWLDNNQEIYRQTMNVEVGDRAQHEIYMPVFKAAFEAGAAAVMCSYNKVYGEHACQNSRILKKLLRDDLGFKGFVMSDWGATHDGFASVLGGLDVEMPENKYTQSVPTQFYKDDKLEPAMDQMAEHVLASMFYVGQFDGKFPVKGQLPKYGLINQDVTTDAHRAVARQTIEDSAVLLKNTKGTLPVKTAGKKIALVGNYCDQLEDNQYKQGSVWSGGGSGFVDTAKGITPLKGLKEHVKDADISFSNDASAAEGADVVVLCLAAHGEEGWDRANFSLPQASDLLKGVRKISGDAKVVVFAAIPGAVTTEWAHLADAVLVTFMPGEQVGPAFARLITGEASPTGRLPIGLPEPDEKRFTTKQYPGECDHGKNKWCEHLEANFSEGVLIGYRWNDAKGVKSAYPFGFGLDYGEVTLGGFEATCEDGKATVSLKVSNEGERDATAVPQLYVGFPSLAPALRQLRGFRKVRVPKGKAAKVTFKLSDEDWSYFDEGKQQWVSALTKGEAITVSVGTSSADLLWTKDLPCGTDA